MLFSIIGNYSHSQFFKRNVTNQEFREALKEEYDMDFEVIDYLNDEVPDFTEEELNKFNKLVIRQIEYYAGRDYYLGYNDNLLELFRDFMNPNKSNYHKPDIWERIKYSQFWHKYQPKFIINFSSKMAEIFPNGMYDTFKGQDLDILNLCLLFEIHFNDKDKNAMVESMSDFFWDTNSWFLRPDINYAIKHNGEYKTVLDFLDYCESNLTLTESHLDFIKEIRTDFVDYDNARRFKNLKNSNAEKETIVLKNEEEDYYQKTNLKVISKRDSLTKVYASALNKKGTSAYYFYKSKIIYESNDVFDAWRSRNKNYTDSVIIYADKALKLNPNKPIYAYYKVLELYRREDKNALNEMNLVASASDTVAIFNYYRARLLNANGQKREAYSILKNNKHQKINFQKIEFFKTIESELSKKWKERFEVAKTHWGNRDNKKAIELLTELLSDTELLYTKNSAEYISNLDLLILAHNRNMNYSKSLPLKLEITNLTNEFFGSSSIEYIESLNGLGVVYSNLNDQNSSLTTFLKAYRILTSNKELENEDVYATVLSNIGDTYRLLGRNKDALEKNLLALEIRKKLSPESLDVSNSMSKIAHVYMELNDLEKAIEFYKGSLEIDKKILDKDNEQLGFGLYNLAFAYYKFVDLENAWEYLSQYRENTLANYNQKHERFGNHENLASLILKRNYHLNLILNKNVDVEEENDLDFALEYGINSLDIAEKTEGKQSFTYAIRLSNVADIYDKLGFTKKGYSIMQESVAIFEGVLGKNNPYYKAAVGNLLSFSIALKDYKSAVLLTKQLNDLTKQELTEVLEYRSEEENLKYLSAIDGNYDAFESLNFSLNLNDAELTSMNLNNLLTRKGLLLKSYSRIPKKLATLNDAIINKKVRYYRTLKSKWISSSNYFSNTKKDSLKNIINNLEIELVQLFNKKFPNQNNVSTNWKKIDLKSDECIIEFTNFDLYNKKWTDSTMYVAYLYKKEWDTPKAINLFEEKQLKKYITNTSSPKKLYKTRGSTSENINTSIVADSIYNLVWKPLEKYTKDIKNIYYSPDGLLHKIPFAALPNKDNKLLGQIHNLNQMGNTADIRKNTTRPDLNGVVLIGGIDYNYIPRDALNKKRKFEYSILESELLLGDKENRNRSSNGSTWSKLDGTQREIDRIKTLLPKSTVLSGKNATETAFKNLSGNSPSILHIATHGYFFPDLKKKKEDNIAVSDKPYIHAENPLLRSGLIFANANYAWSNGNNPYEEDDGILTGLEISNLDLKQTDIVILSACETGLGDIPSTEGVYGLQRAYKMAGVKTIIMTLWEVPDTETAEFMDLFYTNWVSSKQPKKAFKEAQAIMMEKYRDEPEKWAAFVLME